MLNTLLNLLWLVFGGGFITALEYALAGVLLSVTVVGLPFGLQCFKLAELALWPFGRDVVEPANPGLTSTLANVLWIVFAGFWIALTHLALAVPLAVSLIGIPFAWQHLKFAVLALWPFGRALRG
jgi:uncharacterized membrane protein YccF (DUF307 family)